MADVNVININFERNVFNINGDQIQDGDNIAVAVLMQLLAEQFEMLDDEALTLLTQAANQETNLQALPPWAQKQREEKALLELLKQEGYLSDDLEEFPIITKNEDGTLHIETKEYAIDAKIVYDPPEKPLCGPAQFHIEILAAHKK